MATLCVHVAVKHKSVILVKPAAIKPETLYALWPWFKFGMDGGPLKPLPKWTYFWLIVDISLSTLSMHSLCNHMHCMPFQYDH